ncbi:MAG: hypothetical protein F4Y02_13205 [Chloroflexi bacterium]|nr:hypothetical protein [Chloroflexota bacterium]
MQKTTKDSGPTELPDTGVSQNPVNAPPDFDLLQDIITKFENSTAERPPSRRDVLSSFHEAKAVDKSDGIVSDAELRSALVALCFDIVRQQAKPDERLRRFLLCEIQGGKPVVLRMSLDECAPRRERDRILAAAPTARLYLLREDYVRVAASVHSDVAEAR